MFSQSGDINQIEGGGRLNQVVGFRKKNIK